MNESFEARSETKSPNKAIILGVGVHSTRMVEVLKILTDKMAEKTFAKPYFVVTVNPEFIMTAQKDPEFRAILNKADLAIPDGAGLRLAGIRNFVPGRLVVSKLLEKKLKVFFLGGKDGVAKKMAEKYGGAFDPGHSNIQYQISNIKLNTEIINKINKYKPDLLLVVYGAPWQEKWIAANLDKLQAKVVIGVGGAFDYLTGKAKLPPEWMEKAGLEWLWRLIHEPRRWRRQLKLIRFVWLILMKN